MWSDGKMDEIESKEQPAANRRRLDVESVSVPVAPPLPPITRHPKTKPHTLRLEETGGPDSDSRSICCVPRTNAANGRLKHKKGGVRSGNGILKHLGTLVITKHYGTLQ
ncbi:hypothetical protein GW17_00000691 [Ensete ventricosum]|nr:hypothetical protein GW17_00000691 [Ensete ventricosum]